MDPYSMDQVFISVLVSWGLTLGAAALIRFGLHQKPLNKGWAVGCCGAFWIGWMAFGASTGESINQGALFVLLLATYFLLRTGGTRAESASSDEGSEQPKSPAPSTPPDSRREMTSKADRTLSDSSPQGTSTWRSPAKRELDWNILAKGFGISLGVIAMLLLIGFLADRLLAPGDQASSTIAISEWWDDDSPHTVAALSEWAAVGNVAAQLHLANRLSEGRGTLRDPYQAHCWFSHAAARGHPAAMNHLGVIYWRGDGVEPDKLKAHALFNLAAARGSEQAARNLDRIEGQLSDEEHVQAVRLARIWDEARFSNVSRHAQLPSMEQGAQWPPTPAEDLGREYSCYEL